MAVLEMVYRDTWKACIVDDAGHKLTEWFECDEKGQFFFTATAALRFNKVAIRCGFYMTTESISDIHVMAGDTVAIDINVTRQMESDGWRI